MKRTVQVSEGFLQGTVIQRRASICRELQGTMQRVPS